MKNVGGIGSLRRDSYSASTNSRVGGRTSGTPTTASNQRRITSSGMSTQQALNEASRKSGQDQTKQVSVPVLPARGTRQVQDRKYNSTNRTYTPSYNNPRMSTRPTHHLQEADLPRHIAADLPVPVQEVIHRALHPDHHQVLHQEGDTGDNNLRYNSF